MADYIRRFLIAGIMGLCVSLLFLGGISGGLASDTTNTNDNQRVAKSVEKSGE